MKSFGVLFSILVCFAFANLAAACPLATASVVESCDAFQPAQPVVAVQALAVPSVAVRGTGHSIGNTVCHTDGGGE